MRLAILPIGVALFLSWSMALEAADVAAVHNCLLALDADAEATVRARRRAC